MIVLHTPKSSQVLGRRPGGFTLIELLVVIAIIALLMSIVVPALRKVKEQAQITICGSNQRQLIYGLAAYANDQNDRLPPSASNADIHNPNNGNYHRPFELNWLVGNPVIRLADDFHYDNYVGQYLGSYLPDVGVFNCTASPIGHDTPWPPDTSGRSAEGTYGEFYRSGRFVPLHSTYMLLWNYQGYNRNISGHIDPQSAHFEGPRTMTSSNRLVVQDSLFYLTNNTNILFDNPQQTWYSSHRFRGGGRTVPYFSLLDPNRDNKPSVRLNAGYLDGRVERFHSDDMNWVKNHIAEAYITRTYR